MPDLTLVTSAHPLRVAERRIEVVPARGRTVAELLFEHDFRPRGGRLLVHVDGRRLSDAEVQIYRPTAGELVVAHVVAAGGGGSGGGKNVGRILATLALVVLTVLTAGATAPLLGVAEGTALATVVNAVGAGVVSLGGMMAINAILPPPGIGSNGLATRSASPILSGTRNRARPYDALPRVYGRFRVYPDLIAEPWIETQGGKTYMRLLFGFGRGPLDFSDLKIGDNPLLAATTSIDYVNVMEGDGAYRSVEIEVRKGTGSDAAITLYPADVHTDQNSARLVGRTEGRAPNDSSRRVVRVTQRDTDEVSCDLHFPLGCYFQSDKGKVSATFVKFTCEYRAVGATTWTKVTGGASGVWFALDTGYGEVGGKYQQPATFGFRFKLPSRGQYEIGLTRITHNSGDKGLIDVSYWTALRSIKSASSLFPSGTAVVAMRILATGQLNGVIDTFSAVCTSHLKRWTGSAWTTDANTNPAAVYLHLLQGDDTARPVPDAQVDLDTIKAACVRCANEHRECNIVFEGEGTLIERLRVVAASMRGSFHVKDGKYSLLFDDEQTTPRQLYTPRNSWGFRGTKIFAELPHALRVRFRDPSRGYEVREEMVYDDGYNADGTGGKTAATRFEDLELPGITNPRIAWKDARYYLAVGRLRAEQYEISVDMENLANTRGDYVRLQSDVLSVGIAASRCKAVTLDGSSRCVSVTIEGTALLETAVTYGVVVRRGASSTLAQVARQITTVVGEQSTLTFSTPIPAGDPHPAAGDLIVVGVLGSESIDCLIRSIEPIENLAARLTLVPFAAAVYDADTSTPPAWAADVLAAAAVDIPRAPSSAPAAPVVTSVSSSAGQSSGSSGTPPAQEETSSTHQASSAGGTIVIQTQSASGKKKPKPVKESKAT